MCPVLKKLSNTLQPYHEVVQVIEGILVSKKGDCIRILEHLLPYAEYQFGKPIIGKIYRERTDGQRIANWDVDIGIFFQISNKLVDLSAENSSLGTMIRDKGMFPHLEKSLHILSPWMATIDTDNTNQSNSLNSKQKNYLLEESRYLERKMALVAMNRNEFDLAEGHCLRSLVNSRRIGLEGEEKTTFVFLALGDYVNLRQAQGDYSGAVSFAEEAYNLVVDAYDPGHPEVQETAGWLIAYLIGKGDFFNAERFAEQTYANLRDNKNGINQEGELVAESAHNWADVILRQEYGDLIKAEGLARESILILDQLHKTDDSRVSGNCMLLARILQRQGKFGDETKELLESSLAISIRAVGPDGGNTAVVNAIIGEFHYRLAMIPSIRHIRRTQLLLSKSYLNEAIRIETKIHNPTHPNRVRAVSLLSDTLNGLSSI
jgi:hypothetical protein